MRSFFKRSKAVSSSTEPQHCDVPRLRHADIAAVYYNQRVAGDFYEFVSVGASRVLFALLDVAGRREHTRGILIAAQRTFRTLAPKLFAGDDFNETAAMIELCHEVNRTVLEGAGGIRSCPAFMGCYNDDLGTVCYANAGHTPGLLRDHTGITPLEATGLPLGLFSHATHSASTCALEPGAVLLIVSRGIVEAEYNGADFGLEGAKASFQQATGRTAKDLCLTILHAAEQFTRVPPTNNDVTALALFRDSRANNLWAGKERPNIMPLPLKSDLASPAGGAQLPAGSRSV